jgi:CO/xanthine dehydrogenase Mo-binding subunit
MAAEELGINPARISARHGDIESIASDFGTPASRHMAMSGGVGRAPAVCKRWDGGSHWGLF